MGVGIGELTTWSTVSAGGSFSIAITTTGAMWSWGINAEGQLGLGNKADRSSPVQVGALTTWSKIAGASQHCLAIKTDGTLWSWGRGLDGRLGQNNVTYLSSPVQVGADTTWLSLPKMPLAAHSLAIKG